MTVETMLASAKTKTTRARKTETTCHIDDKGNRTDRPYMIKCLDDKGAQHDLQEAK